MKAIDHQSPVAGSIPHIRIKPTRGWSSLGLGEVWRYRELLGIFAERDIKLRYKQTALGVLWVLLQPLVAAAIFAAVFGKLARLPSDGIPYPLFAYAGLVGWTYFSSTVTRGGNSLLGQSSLITKVYFPRLVMPLSSAVSPLIDLLVGLVLLCVMMAAYRVVPTGRLLMMPCFVVLMMLTGAAVALWLSALSVYYRDFHHTTPFLIQAWMYATPVAYSLSLIPEKWRTLYAANPMVAGVEGIRWSLLGRGSLSPPMVGLSAVVSVLLFFGGLLFFRRVERTFADVI